MNTGPNPWARPTAHPTDDLIVSYDKREKKLVECMTYTKRIRKMAELEELSEERKEHRDTRTMMTTLTAKRYRSFDMWIHNSGSWMI